MAKQLPKAQEENTGEWLNTYADMVTLLLTFFVLLFACSNMDETKMQFIVQAFQMRGKFVNTYVGPQNPSDSSDTIGITDNPPVNAGGEGEMPQSFDELYQYLSQYIDENDLGQSIALENGAAHITIRFDDGVFFDGDSHILKPEGRSILSGIIPGIKAVHNSIENITVSGHTADVTHPIINPYSLSANRAVSVQYFLDFNETLPSKQYIVTGYGPIRPVESNDTEAGRAKNRRVELMFLRKQSELDTEDPEVIRDILEHQFNLPSQTYDPNAVKTDPETLPEGSAEKIVANIQNRYEGHAVSGGGFGPSVIDGSAFLADTGNSKDAEK